MNTFIKIGEIIFKIIASILILLVLILESFSTISKITKRGNNHDTNKNIIITPLKKTQSY